MDITGKIKVIGTTEQVSDKFKKRELVLTDTSSQYPQHISFQLTQDKCSLVDSYRAGDEIRVMFNLRGKEWTSPKGEVKYFNTLEIWKVESGNVSVDTKNARDGFQEESKETFSAATESDDLPF